MCGDARNNRIETLDTNNKRLSIEDVEGVTAALAITTSVKSASMAWGILTDAHAHLVAEALRRNVGLEHFNFKGNELTSAGLGSLTEALMTNRTLRSLDLGNNNLDADGARQLGTLLRAETSVLERLNVENNPMGSEGARYVAEALAVNGALTSLSLRGCRVGDEGAQSVAQALRTNSGLKYLGLGVNPISDVGIVALMEGLQCNAAPSAAAPADELQPSVGVQALELDSTSIEDAGYEHIADFLASNTTLTRLNLRGNRAPRPEVLELLTGAFDTNMAMQELSLILPLSQMARINAGCVRNQKPQMVLNVKVAEGQTDSRSWRLTVGLMSGRSWDVLVPANGTFADLRAASLEAMDPTLKASEVPLRFVLPDNTVLGPRTPLSSVLQTESGD